MAGSKSVKSREDGTKKRKRDIIEADEDTKRHRKDQKAKKAAQGREKTESSLQKASKSEVAPLAQSKTTVLTPTENAASSWKISKPMGGRMLDIDPILTEDEG